MQWSETGLRPQHKRHITIRFTCWINKATNTHSDYVVHISFPRQQWLRERASMIPYLCIACLLQKYANSAVDKSIRFLNILHTHFQHAAVINPSVNFDLT